MVSLRQARISEREREKRRTERASVRARVDGGTVFPPWRTRSLGNFPIPKVVVVPRPSVWEEAGHVGKFTYI